MAIRELKTPVLRGLLAPDDLFIFFMITSVYYMAERRLPLVQVLKKTKKSFIIAYGVFVPFPGPAAFVQEG
jgi:hypothetical protein